MKQIVRVITAVVSYNPYQSGFFPRCLEHIMHTTLEHDDFVIEQTVMLVDNLSSDQTASLVKQAFSSVHIIETGKNLGYAGGYNRAFEYALAHGFDFVAIVTQDVSVTPEWLIELVKEGREHPEYGLLQPLLLLWNQQDKINSLGNAIHFLGYGYATGYQMPKANYPYTETKEIPYASGAALLVSVKALKDVGGFDEEFWMYNEDQDLGWRMWLLGYKNVLVPKSTAYHQYEFSRSISKMYFMDRNRLMVLFQNYHWATLLLIFPALFLNELASLLLAFFGGWGKEKLRSLVYFFNFQHWRMILEKRRRRQAMRKATDKEILARFTGKILFQDVMSPVVEYVANPILTVYFILLKFIVWW